MIFDDFKNIDLYDIDETVKNFILNIDSEIEEGKHIISDKAFVNIDVYDTRDKETLKLEAHKKYIDIQFLIKGKEEVYTTDLSDLEEEVPYNEEKDVTFYKNSKKELNLLHLTKNKFIVLFPDDVHAPCISLKGKTEKVKKAIVKILI